MITSVLLRVLKQRLSLFRLRIRFQNDELVRAIAKVALQTVSIAQRRNDKIWVRSIVNEKGTENLFSFL